MEGIRASFRDAGKKESWKVEDSRRNYACT